MADKVRAHAVVEGSVQMVFFRYSTCEQAARLRVTGWVMNRPEGSVELVAEGSREDVDALIEWCRTGPPHASVTGVSVTEEPYTGEFKSFEARFGGA